MFRYSSKSLQGLFIILCFSFLSCSDNKVKNENRAVFVSKTSDGYRLFRNGEPFFIKGAAGNSHFNALQKAGANTIRIYDTLNLKQILNEAHENGLAVIVDIPFPRYSKEFSVYEDKNFISIHSNAVKQLVLNYKDHPALLFWMLGNEISYPYVYGNRHFYSHFNGLIDMIHEIDPNHPISSAFTSFSGYRTWSVNIRSPSLDFISLNIFGELTSLEEKKKKYTPWIDQPFFISEWGINGPWEETKNLWGVPKENHSTDKAIITKERYKKFIADKRNCLGSAAFYWGTKHESTATWFNLFTEKDEKTQLVFELENIWKNKTEIYDGPTLEDITLNESTSTDQIFLIDERHIKASISYNYSGNDTLSFRWDLKPENWNFKTWDNERPVESINDNILCSDRSEMVFKAPEIEGPYRIYCFITDSENNVATANIPFYALNPPKGIKN